MRVNATRTNIIIKWKCIEVVMAMRTARHYAHLATYIMTNLSGSVSKWS